MTVAVYVFVMAVVTYLIRMVPFTFFRKKIKSKYVRSFLKYIPYAVLSAMTIPAIFTATSSIISACVGFIVAIALALKGKSLTVVALISCAGVYLTELILTLL